MTSNRPTPQVDTEATTFSEGLRTFDRRSFLRTAAAGLAAAGLAACGAGTSSHLASKSKAASSPAGGPLPTKVPSGTTLSVASSDEETQVMFQLSGLLKDLTFQVTSWPNIGAGPLVIDAFRAGSLDVAFNAGIPPIQAHYEGYPAKIVAVGQNRKPDYIFLTRPHSNVETVEQFRGKKLAFSQGQAQGVVLLRALKKAGVPFSDVKLVPLTSVQFLTALEANQVDVAPVSLNEVPLYLDKYASEGAHTIKTDVVDFLSIAWSPTKVLADEAKVAAIVELIPLYAKGNIWTWTHEEEWVKDYWVKTQQVTEAQGRQIQALEGKPWFPTNWDKAIAWEQETADLLAEGGFVKKFDVSVLFDRRFEHLAYKAVPSTYWS